MFEFLRKPVFLIILAAALIIGGVWAYIANRNNAKKAEQQAQQQAEQAQQAQISNLTNIAATTLNDSIASQLAIADEKAAAVDKKNVLIAVEVHLLGDLATNSGDTSYVYSSTSDKVNNWLITISNSSNNFLRARTPKEDYLGDLKPVNRSYWKVNYVSALQTAEKAGGLDFRNANDVSEVKLTLKNADPKGFLYWFVSYTAKNNAKQYQLDASTGAIVTQ